MKLFLIIVASLSCFRDIFSITIIDSFFYITQIFYWFPKARLVTYELCLRRDMAMPRVSLLVD